MRARLDRMFKGGAAACCLCMLFAVQAKAQETVALTCNGATVCSAAGGAFATQSTTANPPTFTVSNTDGTKCGTGDTCEAYLAVLVPNGTLSAGFTVNGVGASGTGTFNSGSASLWAALGEGGGQDNTFTPWQTSSAAAGSSITAAGSFTVYDFLLGTFTGPGSFSSATVSLLGSAPIGTGFGAFYEDTNMTGADGQIVNNTKLSESLVDDTAFVATPEPGSMVLLGSGLLVLGAAIRKRLCA